MMFISRSVLLPHGIGHDIDDIGHFGCFFHFQGFDAVIQHDQAIGTGRTDEIGAGSGQLLGPQIVDILTDILMEPHAAAPATACSR